MGIDRPKTRHLLKTIQVEIRYESDEDDAAAEFHGEVQSVIDVIDKAESDENIMKAAEWVGLDDRIILNGRQ